MHDAPSSGHCPGRRFHASVPRGEAVESFFSRVHLASKTSKTKEPASVEVSWNAQHELPDQVAMPEIKQTRQERPKGLEGLAKGLSDTTQNV